MQEQQQQQHDLSTATHIAVASATPGTALQPTAAAGVGACAFQLPQLLPDTPLSAVEPALYGLLDHFGLPDELAEQLAEALEGLGADELAEQQQQQQAESLGRFQADYAQVRYLSRETVLQAVYVAGACHRLCIRCATTVAGQFNEPLVL
jgi:hypothetical protein